MIKKFFCIICMMVFLVSMKSFAKTVVIYYSYTNHCHEIVAALTSQITADVVRIEPAEKDLKYEADNYALGTQLLNAIKDNPSSASSYPAIDPVTVNLADYDNVIVVTPLWWSQMAAIMQTYLFNNSAQMAGKTVAMIVSSYSSSISGVVADAQRLLPNVTWAGDALWINNSNHSNRASLIEDWLTTINFKQSTMTNKIQITIDGNTQTASLVDNAATQALVSELQKGSVTVTLNDNNFEIWGALGFSLPQSNELINAQPGDIVLYNGSNICIFYGSNSYSYTPLGKIEGLSVEELKSFLKAGENGIAVTLSVPNSEPDEDVITIKDIGKTTWCSEYDLDFTNVSVIKAYIAIGYDDIDKTIWLARVMKVPAGMGLLVKGDAGTYKIPHSSVRAYYTNMFKGNLGETIQISEIDGNMTNYYLSGKDGTFVSVNGNANIGKNKAYLQLPTSIFAGTRTIGISYDDEDGTTGIKEVKSGKVKGEKWFTLQGQRVDNPGKGIYIKNGKKVVIK